MQGRRLDPGTASEALNELVNENRHIVLLRLLDATGKGSFFQNPSLSTTAERELEPVLREAFTANLAGRSVRRDLLRLPGEDPMVLTSLPVRTPGGGGRRRHAGGGLARGPGGTARRGDADAG